MRLQQLEAASLLRLEPRLIRVEPAGDLRIAVLLDRRPVAIRDRDEDVPVRPAVAVEPGRSRLDLDEAATGELLAQDRPVVALEQLDELVERTPADAVVVRDGDWAGHCPSLAREPGLPRPTTGQERGCAARCRNRAVEGVRNCREWQLVRRL